MGEIETWVPVAGYEGWYEVSDAGRVRSVPRALHDGRVFHGKVLAQTPRLPGGHVYVDLSRNGRRRRLYIHTLVLRAFVGPGSKGEECCHGDGNPRSIDNGETQRAIAKNYGVDYRCVNAIHKRQRKFLCQRS